MIDIEQCSYGCFLVTLGNNKYMAFNTNGESNIGFLIYDLKRVGDFFTGKHMGKYGVINRNLDTVLEFEYYLCEGVTYENYNFIKFGYNKGGSIGLLDAKGNIVAECKYDSFDFKNGFIKTASYNRYGLMDIEGNVIIECKYDSLDFKNGFVITEINCKYGLLDIQGNVITECKYDSFEVREGEEFIGFLLNGSSTADIKSGLIDKKGNVILEIEGSSERYYKIRLNGT